MIIYNNIIKRLADNGWTVYRLEKEKVLSSSTITNIYTGKSITTAKLNTICELCKCQPGELLTWIPDEEGRE